METSAGRSVYSCYNTNNGNNELVWQMCHDIRCNYNFFIDNNNKKAVVFLAEEKKYHCRMKTVSIQLTVYCVNPGYEHDSDSE